CRSPTPPGSRIGRLTPSPCRDAGRQLIAPFTPAAASAGSTSNRSSAEIAKESRSPHVPVTLGSRPSGTIRASDILRRAAFARRPAPNGGAVARLVQEECPMTLSKRHGSVASALALAACGAYLLAFGYRAPSPPDASARQILVVGAPVHSLAWSPDRATL